MRVHHRWRRPLRRGRCRGIPVGPRSRGVVARRAPHPANGATSIGIASARLRCQQSRRGRRFCTLPKRSTSTRPVRCMVRRGDARRRGERALVSCCLRARSAKLRRRSGRGAHEHHFLVRPFHQLDGLGAREPVAGFVGGGGGGEGGRESGGGGGGGGGLGVDGSGGLGVSGGGFIGVTVSRGIDLSGAPAPARGRRWRAASVPWRPWRRRAHGAPIALACARHSGWRRGRHLGAIHGARRRAGAIERSQAVLAWTDKGGRAFEPAGHLGRRMCRPLLACPRTQAPDMVRVHQPRRRPAVGGRPRSRGRARVG